jgi:uncharacterized protein (DUF1778 family)
MNRERPSRRLTAEANAKPLQIRIPPSQLAEIRAAAQASDVTVSAFIRAAARSAALNILDKESA